MLRHLTKSVAASPGKRRGFSPRGLPILLALALAAWPAVATGQHVHEEPAQGPAAPADAAASHDHHMPAPLPPFIPALTDADRAAAFPDVGDHVAHGHSSHAFVLVDHLEWGSGADAIAIEAKGWVGGDLDRLWFRAHGASGDDSAGSLSVFYGRAIARWWELLAGVQQDLVPGAHQTWAAIGLQGLAPYWFEVEATAYLGASGRTRFHVSTEYELLLTNRLVLQPAVSLDLAGRADPDRRIGAGLGAVEAALRLRYEIRPELAPYMGVVWQRRTFGSADLARSAGETVRDRRFVAGVRVWF